MGRNVTIFTGQWADLSLAELAEKMSEIGYDGLEIACWGDHLNVEKAVKDSSYLKERREILNKYELGVWAIGNHLAGQCVGARYDPRLDNFAPEKYASKPEEIRKWAVEEMKLTAEAANKLGVELVTGFTGSPIWKFFYSFPQTTEEMIEEGFEKIVELWNPILDVFAENGVKFALEVHPTEIAFDFYTTQRLLEKFDWRPEFGINFDPSHLIWQGMTPHLFLREFSKRIYHVHMKDAGVTLNGRESIIASHLPFGDRRRGWDFRSLGHGDIDFDEIIRELNAMNYTGPLSVEWEDSGMDRIYGAKEALNFVRNVDFKASNLAFDGSMEK
mgnify:FL=1